jgi:hypothetical protein
MHPNGQLAEAGGTAMNCSGGNQAERGITMEAQAIRSGGS